MTHIPTAHEVETRSGQYVDTKNPKPDTISLEDIAWALGHTCRYGGHCSRFYSVAEHAVFVSKRLERKGEPKHVQLAGLHHDDAEAYLGDIPRPMKSLLGPAYTRLTWKMDRAIVHGLGLEDYGVDEPDFHLAEVKAADNWALFVEARHLLPSGGRHWFSGAQGADTWGLGDQPSRIVTPDYWFEDEVTAPAAAALFLHRHRELTGTA